MNDVRGWSLSTVVHVPLTSEVEGASLVAADESNCETDVSKCARLAGGSSPTSSSSHESSSFAAIFSLPATSQSCPIAILAL